MFHNQHWNSIVSIVYISFLHTLNYSCWAKVLKISGFYCPSPCWNELIKKYTWIICSITSNAHIFPILIESRAHFRSSSAGKCTVYAINFFHNDPNHIFHTRARNQIKKISSMISNNFRWMMMIKKRWLKPQKFSFWKTLITFNF